MLKHNLLDFSENFHESYLSGKSDENACEMPARRHWRAADFQPDAGIDPFGAE